MGLPLHALTLERRYASPVTIATQFFESRFARLPTTPVARAYVVGLFTQQVSQAVDFADESLTLTYTQVRHERDLHTLQALGDWVLWADATLPGVFNGYRELAQSIGRASYYRCYRLVNSWRVYEELADQLPVVTRFARGALEPPRDVSVTLR